MTTEPGLRPRVGLQRLLTSHSLLLAAIAGLTAFAIVLVVMRALAARSSAVVEQEVIFTGQPPTSLKGEFPLPEETQPVAPGSAPIDGLVEWRYGTDHGVSFLRLLPDGGLLALLRDKDRYGGTVVALDQQGRVQWSHRAGSYPDHYLEYPAIDRDGNAYMVHNSNSVLALSRAGDVLWDTQLTEGFGLREPLVTRRGPLVVRVQPESGAARIVSLDREQGTVDWERELELEHGVRSSLVEGPGGELIGLTDDGGVFCLDDDGALRWELFHGIPGFATPVVGSRHRVHVCGASEGKYPEEREGLVCAIDIDDGTVESSYQLPRDPSFAPALARDGTLYVSSNNELVALAPDGTIRWRVDNCFAQGAPVVRDDGALYVTTSGGGFKIITAGGEVLLDLYLGEKISTPPLLLPGGLVAFACGNEVLALQP